MRGKWFAGLPAALRRELLARGGSRRFPRGSWVYLQGDPPRGLWAVLEGEISFSKVGASGTEVIYHVGGPGLWFGVLGVLTGLPLGLAITAMTELSLLFVRRKDVLQIIDDEPRHVLRLVRLPLERGIDLLDLVEHIVRPEPAKPRGVPAAAAQTHRDGPRRHQQRRLRCACRRRSSRP